MKQLKKERELKRVWKYVPKSLFITNIKRNPKLLKFYTGFPNYEIVNMVLTVLGREAASQLVYSNN